MNQRQKKIAIAAGGGLLLLLAIRKVASGRALVGPIEQTTVSLPVQAMLERQARSRAIERAFDLLAIDWEKGDAGLPTRRPTPPEAAEIHAAVQLLGSAPRYFTPAQRAAWSDYEARELAAHSVYAHQKLPASASSRPIGQINRSGDMT